MQTSVDENGTPIYTTIPPGWMKILVGFKNNSKDKPVTIMVLKSQDGARPIASLTVANSEGHEQLVDSMFCGAIPIEVVQGKHTYAKNFKMTVLGYVGTFSEPSARLLKTMTFSSQ